MKIINQWKYHFNTLHYSLFLKQSNKVLNDMIKEREKNITKKVNKIKNLNKIKVEKLSEIKSITKEDDIKTIMLVGKKLKETPFQKVIKFFFKFDGYIFYGNTASDWKIIKVKDLSKILNLKKKKETYGLVDKIGSHKGKPIYMIKYPYTLSLHISDTDDQIEYYDYYDPKEFYAYVNHATKLNILNITDSGNMMAFFKKNILLIIVVILVIIFLSTPQGQQFLQDILSQAGVK